MGGETEEDPPNHNTDQIWGNYRPSSHHKPGNTAMDAVCRPHTRHNAHIFKHTNNGDENDLFFIGAKINRGDGRQYRVHIYYNLNISVMFLIQIDM